MTRRDRLVVLAVLAAGLLAAFWFLVLGPKREEAGSLAEQIAAQEQRLDAARAGAGAALQAKRRYERDYAAVAELGQAVPADDDVSSLVYQLDHAARSAKVDFRSLKLGEATGNTGRPPAATTPPAPAQQAAPAQGSEQKAGSQTPAQPPAAPPSPAPATQAAAASLPPGASVGPAGFPTMPFAFTFDGSFFDMQRFFVRLDRFTRVRRGQVDVRGRLLAIDAFRITAGRDGFPDVKADIDATAYVLPPGEGLTNGATAQGPTSIASRGAAGGSAGPAAPAVATPLIGSGR